MVTEEQLRDIHVFIVKMLRVFPESEIVIRGKPDQDMMSAHVTVRRWHREHHVETRWTSYAFGSFSSNPRDIWELTADSMIRELIGVMGKPEVE